VTVRRILRWPDPRLARPAAPAGEVTDEIRVIWDDMVDTMEAVPGVGLAAPQIGLGLRLAVVDASDARGWAIRLADPEILAIGPETAVREEASPCLPGLSARVARPSTVTVAYTDADGQRVSREFDGLWATSVQHQIDHLEGRLYVHRLSRVKREMLLKRAARRRA
jgi:peptide deformylase